MNRDDFARAVLDRLPKECPGKSRREILGALFGGVAEVIHELPAEEVDETEKAVCASTHSAGDVHGT